MIPPTRPPLPQPAEATDVGTLPLAGAAATDGSAQAIAIVPTLQAAPNAADTGGSSDTQNLFLVLIVLIVAIPVVLTMTLLATVLTRR